ncbi:MAG: hypothetical protein IJ068_00380 [Bacilli bacterium]|nr:hypothetical protein [Bacilli bacterium]
MYVDIKEKDKRKELLCLLEKKSYKYKNFKRDDILKSDLPIHIYLETKEIGMLGNRNYVKVSNIKYTSYEDVLDFFK